MLVEVGLRGLFLAREHLGQQELVLQEAVLVGMRPAARAAQQFVELLAALGILALAEMDFGQIEPRRPECRVLFDRPW